MESLVEHNEERLLMGGTANLTRNTADFGGSLRSILEALEEQVVVLRLLAAQQEAGKVTVRIGHETEAEEMAATSVVSTAYGTHDTIYGAWACSVRPEWTIRELSLPLQQLLCTSAKCWVPDDRAPAAEFVDSRVTRPKSGLGKVRRGTRLLRSARREQERERCGDQTRVSQAGARTAP
ncbi:hrcA C terminal domain protein [Mycobacterium xenopi 3993]|nr:hrcA C terminal domain protein [Mycobacterium xenopi 3993]